MACFDNVQIKQLVTYSSTPDTTNGWIEGQVQLTILNIGASDVEGTITVDRVRQQPVVDLSDPAVSLTNVVTTSGFTYNYKFYYPESEPSSVTINVSVTIKVEDCFYTAQCNHVLLTPNPTNEIASCLLPVQGFDAVSGCTDAAYFEYNPNANVDDGSCATLIPILGCTNPLAINYNANATQNDGTCQFTSGCTNPIANNFDEAAVIDDGSCECGDINFQFDFFSSTGESFVLSGDCQYILEFDLITKIDCEKFLEYFQNDTRTILEILNELKINIQVKTLLERTGENVEYSGGTLMIARPPEYALAQSENIFEFNIENNPVGIGFKGEEETCNILFDLIATELGLECQGLDKSIFDVSWQKHQIVLNSDLAGTFTRFLINYEAFKFGICTYVDNVRFFNVCTTNFRKCVLVPKVYGFEFDRVIDNKKSWVASDQPVQRTFDQIKGRETDYVDYDSRLTLNTKSLELQMNPIKYVQSDVVDYFNNFEKFYRDIDDRFLDLSLDKAKQEYIDVKNRQTIRRYSFLPTIYEQYQDQLECAPSKGLDYDYGFEILRRVGKFWYSLVKQLVPATSIWNENEFILKNNLFHQQKHRYKRYSLVNGGGGGNCAPSGVTVICTQKSERCFDEVFSDIDDIFLSGVSDLVCTKTGDTACFGDFQGEGFFSGKIVRYTDVSGDTGVQREIHEQFGFDDYDCVTGSTPVFGCTNPNAINYDPLADTDNGSCILIPPILDMPVLTVGSFCINSGAQSVMLLTVTGGVPPYTYIGLNPNDILNNGESYSAQVQDSLGTLSLVVNGTVNCPTELCDLVNVNVTASYECEIDEFGFNTTFGILSLSGQFGQAPYSFLDILTNTPYVDGDKVLHGTTVLMRAFDANGCPSSNNVPLTIDCEEPECGDITPELTTTITTISNTSNTALFELAYVADGIPVVFGIDDLTYTITTQDISDIIPIDPLVKSVTAINGVFQIETDYAPDDPQATIFNISVNLVINGSCEFSDAFDLIVRGDIIADSKQNVTNF